MKVLKFGGTSVGSAERMRQVAGLINDDDAKVVVLSAVSGTTNKLEELSECLYQNNKELAKQKIESLKQEYRVLIDELFNTNEYKQKANGLIDAYFDFISGFTYDLFTLYEERAVLAQGELISTGLFQYHLEEEGIVSVLIPALEFMRIDKYGEPDEYYIKENLKREMEKHPFVDIFITQGYICRNAFGEIDNLKRGGSDYTASLIGVGLNAEEIQIWTDIDGMHNNDPRVVEGTQAVKELSYDEAAELAYFGAKILHPSSVLPAQKANIPVRLKNTLNASAEGTLIAKETANAEQVTAIAAKDNITAIKIRSGRMLMAYGFMRHLFEVFERYETPIDMITTSEVAVSLTIDDSTHLDSIVKELRNYGEVEVDTDLTIVCIVGDFLADKHGHAALIFDSLRNIPIRMVSYGGSKNNVSLLVRSSHKKQALEALNEGLFKRREVHV